MEHTNFVDIENLIPETEPSIQIGPISIWVKGVDVENDNPDQIVLSAPFLYKTGKVQIYSASSQIMGFELVKMAKDLSDLYDNTGDKIVEINFDQAEFRIKLTKNIQGHIKLETTYWAWGNEGSGNLVFKDQIDRTYLPNIIKQARGVQSFLK